MSSPILRRDKNGLLEKLHTTDCGKSCNLNDADEEVTWPEALAVLWALIDYPVKSLKPVEEAFEKLLCQHTFGAE